MGVGLSNQGSSDSEFVREDVLQANSEFFQHGFQLVKGQVVFSPLNAVQGGVRKTDFLRELRVGKGAPFLPQE